jgi:hypothetical protein
MAMKPSESEVQVAFVVKLSNENGMGYTYIEWAEKKRKHSEPKVPVDIFGREKINPFSTSMRISNQKCSQAIENFINCHDMYPSLAASPLLEDVIKAAKKKGPDFKVSAELKLLCHVF